jgi:Gas vesicle synthesis protein GvpL/GvpF
VLYLYALTEHPAAVPTARGIDETPLAAERVDGIEAVVGVLDTERVEPSEATILAHARVVDEVAAVNAAVLPARFGRGYADADALRQAVGQSTEALRDALERVRGCLELGLRVLAKPEGAAVTGESGREYMLGRLEERRRVEQLADELHAPLASLARAETHSVGTTPQLVLSASYLVPREDLDAFQAALRDLELAHPALTIACTGPWPPYSFATAEIGMG